MSIVGGEERRWTAGRGMTTGDNIVQLVTFRIGTEEFGIEILQVQEIIRMREVTVVPRAPDFVEGMINLRGHIIPVIDLRVRLQLEAAPRTRSTRIMVVRMGTKTVGMIVDAVSEVLRVPSDIIELPPPLVSGIDTRFINGIGRLEQKILILLDVEKILEDQEMEDLTRMDE